MPKPLSTPEERLKKKRSVFEQWMQEDHVLIHLNGRAEGVCVPKHLAEDPGLSLKLSYHFAGTTEFDEEKITSYLKFSGEYVECVIPWKAIWGMTSSHDENVVFPEDVPKEIFMKMAGVRLKNFSQKILGKKNSEKSSPQKPEKKVTPFLKRIK